MVAGKYVAKSAKNGNERPSIPAPVKFELWTKSMVIKDTRILS